MSHSPPTDDLLLINRQAELPDLLREVLTGMAAELTDAIYEGRDVDPTPILAALGVGKPEQQVRESHLSLVSDVAAHYGRGDSLDDYDMRELPDALDRIERAIGVDHEEVP